MRATITSAAAILLIATVPAACRRDADQRTGTITSEEIAQARANWPAGVAAQVDSGNASYRARDYETAARYFRRAAELGPEVTAAWFGIYMAEHARGNAAAADSAMQRTRQLVPGASLLHATPADTARRRP